MNDQIPDGEKPIKLAMLVDDEPVDQMIYQRIVKRSGLVENVVSLQSAQEALDYLLDPSNPEVDVVFLDINMPRMNGFEFLEAATRQIGPQFAKSCVVMLTTSLNPNDRARAEQFDVVRDFISKPLTVPQLQKVAAMLADGNMAAAL